MNITQYKRIILSICFIVISLCSRAYCAEQNCLSDGNPADIRYAQFLEEYNGIGENHQCILRNMPSLPYASLGIDDESARSIAIGIKYNNKLNGINLNHNNITSEGIRYLAHALSGKPILQFHMCGSKIGDEGHKELAKAIKTWTNLTHLNVNSTDLGDVGAEALADALRGKDKLVEFHFITDNKFSSEGVRKLFSVLANRSY